MDFDFAQISEASSEIGESNSILSTGFDSDWDDEVHDSYGEYIEENRIKCQQLVDQINDVLSLSSEIESVDVDSLLNNVSNVLASVDEL